MKKLYQRVYRKLHDTVYRAFERYDLTAWDVPLSVSLPIYGVYHGMNQPVVSTSFWYE